MSTAMVHNRALNENSDPRIRQTWAQNRLLELQVPGRADQGCRCRRHVERAIQRDIQEPRVLPAANHFSFGSIRISYALSDAI